MSEKSNLFVGALARALWNHEAKAKEGDATREERLAAWKKDRREYMKVARQIEARLTKRGFTITPPANATEEEEEEE